MYQTKELFDLTRSQAGEYLSGFTYPWDALSGLSAHILELGEKLDKSRYREASQGVWIEKSATIAPTVQINPPCIIGAGSEIRHCAFIRGGVLVGENCVVGNSVELKNAVLFDGAQVPHFNYVGDSILGYKAHLGAGAITSNVKSDKTPVVIKDGNESIDTGRKKVGAMLGDFVEVGCNSVLNPGTVVGKNARIYPLSCVRGTVKANHVYKSSGNITQIK